MFCLEGNRQENKQDLVLRILGQFEINNRIGRLKVSGLLEESMVQAEEFTRGFLSRYEDTEQQRKLYSYCVSVSLGGIVRQSNHF